MKKRNIILLLMILFLYCLLLGDKQIIAFMNAIRNPILTHFFTMITEFGDVLVIIPLLIIVSAYHFKMGLRMSLLSLAGILFNSVLKNVFQRERPAGIHLVSETTYSFPSGHSMMSMLVYGMLFLVVSEYIKDSHLQKGLKFLLISIILCVGISRMYLNVHYASDVLGGFFVGFLCLCYIHKSNALIKLELK